MAVCRERNLYKMPLLSGNSVAHETRLASVPTQKALQHTVSARETEIHAAFKSSRDIRTYELTSHSVWKKIRFNFSTINFNDFLRLYIYKMMNKEYASLCFCFFCCFYATYEGDVNRYIFYGNYTRGVGQ